jgi:hypothetical protein
MNCNWPNCQNVRFSSPSLLAPHQLEHVEHLCAIAKSKNSFRCSWPACRMQKSGKPFSTLANLKKHLKTHIVKTLQCTHSECEYDGFFSRLSGVDRHVKAKHSKLQTYPCPVESCGQDFTRKDKLMEHARTKHGVFRCHFDHCGA